MLTGRDKQTGLGMSDQNIKYNVRRHGSFDCIAADLVPPSSF